MNMSVIVGILSAVVVLDNALAAIPAIKANSVFQLVSGWLIKLSDLSKL